MQPKVERRMVISNRDLEKIYSFHSELDARFFRYLFNNFLIMEGLSPDIPIGMAAGMMNIDGLWQPGLKYTQYHKWEDRIAEDFGKIAKSGFGTIYKLRN